MALSDFVVVNISLTAQNLTLPGFGTPLLLAHDAPGGWTSGRVRSYTSVAGMVSDGFSASGPTCLMAAKVFAQNPSVPLIKVGRCTNVPTQHFTLTPVVQNSTVYSLTINGNVVSITSGGSATATAIVSALNTAITALSISGLTNGGTTTLTLSMAGGDFLALSVASRSLFAMVQDHSDPGVQADLTAITNEDSNWYAVLNAFNSAAMAEQISQWCEAQGQSAPKSFIGQMTDSACATHAKSGGTDEMCVAQTADRFWTSLWYSNSTDDFLDCALAGSLLTTTPGSETWAMKSLSDVNTTVFTATERANVLAKNGNLYESLGGLDNTVNGTAASGEWIDVVRFRDWLAITMQGEIFLALRALTATQKKLPFTDAGIGIVAARMLAVLKEGVANGGLSDNPAPVVGKPLASSFTSSQRNTRILTGMTFEATLAGAIHAVNPISGTLS